jgi:hypothetical protein
MRVSRNRTAKIQKVNAQVEVTKLSKPRLAMATELQVFVVAASA